MGHPGRSKKLVADESILVMGDTHADEVLLKPEIEPICKEVLSYDADTFIHLGDLLEKHPSYREISFASWFVSELKKKYKRVILITGNHPTVSDDFTSIDFLKYMGAEVVTEIVMDIGKEKWLFGHFFTDETMDFDVEKKNLSDIYKTGVNRAILGHFHDYMLLDDVSFHLGAVRWCRFDEKAPGKYILRINQNKGSYDLLELKSPLKIASVFTTADLSKVDKGAKVRLIIKSFDQLTKEASEIAAWERQNPFSSFRVDYDFQRITTDASSAVAQADSDDFLEERLNKIENVEVRKELEDEFLKEGLIK
jgi:predicted phosphodiesterase